MKPSHVILALALATVLGGTAAALAQAPDPHHPPAATAPADAQRGPAPPQAAPQQPAQPGQPPQRAMMMDCPMMQSGQATAGAVNCRMMQGHMQSGQTPQQAPGTKQ